MKKLLRIKDFILNTILLRNFEISPEKKRRLYIRIFILISLITINYIKLDILKTNQIKIIIDLTTVFLILNVSTNILRTTIVSSYRKRNKLEVDYVDDFIIGINSILFIVSSIIFIIFSFHYFRVEMKSFLTVFGLFFAGLAWVFKEHVVNFVNGLVVLFSKDIRIGDYIKVHNFKGNIRNISFMNIKLKTDDGVFAYIPNTTILSTEIINYSRIKTKKIIFDFEIDYTLFGEIKKLETYLQNKISKQYPDLISKKQLSLKILKIHKDKANIQIEIPVKRYNFTIEDSVIKYTSTQIIKYMNKKLNNKQQSSI